MAGDGQLMYPRRDGWRQAPASNRMPDRKRRGSSRQGGGNRRRRGRARPVARRTRLEIDERRSQLLQFGKQFFATHDYDDVSIDEVAAAAGVSKALLFHYFGSKREFYVETIRAMSLQLRGLTAPDPALPPAARLRAALDAHLGFAIQEGAMYATFCRSGSAISPDVNAILEEHREAVLAHLLENLGIAAAPPLLRGALRAWMFMVEGVCLEAIASPQLKRSDLCELLLSGFGTLLQRTLELEPRSARLVSAMVSRTRLREPKTAAASRGEPVSAASSK